MTPESLAEAGLQYAVEGAVATVTLDRPDARNAQTPATWAGLKQIGDELPDTVRVVVVRGNGHSFSAGLDRAMLDPATGDVARLLSSTTPASVRRSTSTSRASRGCATHGSSASRRSRATRSAPASSWP